MLDDADRRAPAVIGRARCLLRGTPGWHAYHDGQASGPRVQQAVQQELEAVLTRLEKGLPPETFEKVLQLMTAEDDDVDAPATGNLERLPP
jgi:hypothetical protein